MHQGSSIDICYMYTNVYIYIYIDVVVVSHHSLPFKGRTGELAGGWSATIWSIDADLDALSDELGLANVNSKEPCCFCGADETEAPWIHLRKDAKFMKLLLTTRLWRARAGYKHRQLFESWKHQLMHHEAALISVMYTMYIYIYI